MITTPTESTVSSSGVKSEVSFGINTEGLPYIFNILRNSLYSDKVMAVLREVSCNAVDANAEAGNGQRPIRVNLPNIINPVLSIRDFGKGLDDSRINEIYAFYGASTKRNSNEFIGQLGIGSKSPFSYGDNFTITAYVDGVKTVYNAYIDETQVGKIAKLHSESTTEENGTEITVPVRRSDFNEFSLKASSLFCHFKVKPEVAGSDQYDNFTPPRPMVNGGDWAYIGNNVSKAIMGYVGYSIDLDNVGVNYNSDLYRLINSGVNLEFDIGELDMAASREALQYTDKTKRAIIATGEKALRELVESVSLEFDKCTTIWSAKLLFSRLFEADFGSFSMDMRHFVSQSIVWNGSKVSNSHINSSNLQSVKSYRMTRNRRNNFKLSTSDRGGVDVTPDTLVVWNDIDGRPKLINRVKNFLSTNQKCYIQLIEGDVKAFVAETGIEHYCIKGLSELPATKTVRAANGTGSTISKAAGSVFDYCHYSKASSWKSCEDIDLEDGNGMYVITERYDARNGASTLTPQQLNALIHNAREIGIKIDEVHGIRAKYAKNIGDGWTDLIEYVKESTEKLIDNKNVASKLSSSYSIAEIADVLKMTTRANEFGEVLDGSPFAQLMNGCAAASYCSEAEKIRSFAHGIGINININKSDVLLGLAKEVTKKYPLLNHINAHYASHLRKDILDYITAIDKAQSIQ